MRVRVFLIWLVVFVISFSAEAAVARSRQITRVMLFWLNRSGNLNDRNVLLRGMRILCRIRGLNETRIGRALPVDGCDFEQRFDLGGVMIFRDGQVLDKFERDPRRRGALDAIVQRLVRRQLVYSFANE